MAPPAGGFGRNMAKELLEGAGEYAADKTGFAVYAAAKLTDLLGDKAFGALKVFEATLVTTAQALGGNYADVALDGFFDGMGDTVRDELRRIKAMPDAERKAHINKTLKKGSHDAHGADAHGHGDKHDKAHAHAPPTNDVIDFFDALAGLTSEKDKQQAQDFVGYLDECHPDYLGALVYFQGRPGFTRRFFKRITGINDVILLQRATQELIAAEVKKVQAEEAAKPKPLAQRLRHGVDVFQGGINALLDGIGVPPEGAHGGHDPHTLPPPGGMVHANPTPNTGRPGFGDDWNALQRRLKTGGH